MLPSQMAHGKLELGEGVIQEMNKFSVFFKWTGNYLNNASKQNQDVQLNHLGQLMKFWYLWRLR